jgi:pimeloyl-ACP methyl ester carboxylesterase
METAALALLLLALLAAAHYAFWTLLLRVEGTEDEVLPATASDGWLLALGRRRPRGPARGLPVLLIHGLAVNRWFMDFGLERHSLSASLAGAGFDCFALDLRGHGGSRRGPVRDWCFDDYVRLDLPAAVEAVCAATGAGRVLLVGHSQGALIALAVAGLRPERIAGLVAMAGPTRMDPGPALRHFARAAFAFRSATRLLARMIAPFAGFLHLELAQASINTRNTPRPVLRRMLATVVENVPRGVARQFRRWIRADLFRSEDGAVDYRANLARTRVPALFVAAPRDGLAPPAVVRAAHDAWGGEKDWLLAGTDAGLSADYGHGDLIFGRRAPEEIYPRLRDWLVARAADGTRAAPAAGPAGG